MRKLLGNVEWVDDAAGKKTLMFDIGKYCVCIHFLVKEEQTLWGYDQSWFDGPVHEFGLGKLLLIGLIRY